MKKLLLMFVVLITSIANAQDTFNFRCIPAEELAIAAIYEANTPPTGFSDALSSASVIANNAATTQIPYQSSRKNFISLFDNYGLTFNDFITDNSANQTLADYGNNNFSNVPLPGGDKTINSTSEWNAWMLDIAQAIWLYGHPNYDADAVAFTNALEAIYAHGHPPTELGTIINDTALAVNYGDGIGQNPRTNFIKSLAYFNVSVDYVFNYPDKPTEAELSNNNVVPNIGTNANLNNMSPAQFSVFAFEVVKRFWHIGHPTYAAAELRTERINELDALDKDGVNVEVATDALSTLVYPGTDKGAGIYFRVDDYGNGNGKIEDLTPSIYADYKAAIITYRDEIIVANTPTVAKELDAFATGDKPTGSAPEWLPTALYASANTNTNGTKRTAFLVSLSSHGVNITHILNDGSATTHFRVSTGDGYDYTISWAPYGPNGWNKMTAESFRRLAFDVIVLKWKKIHETHNTERSDILDQTLDTDDIDVILITYADDWWIYFNNTGVPILSGGRPLDPMFHNKFTLNPHDTYMTEAEFQKLVVFVTYMRDNYTRLKGITGTFGRNIEISNLTDEFGAGISVVNDGGSYHYTFSKNGNSNEYPVQSNWTHPAGTTLEDLSPDSWVKFYAKCRGIILGL